MSEEIRKKEEDRGQGCLIQKTQNVDEKAECVQKRMSQLTDSFSDLIEQEELRKIVYFGNLQHFPEQQTLFFRQITSFEDLCQENHGRSMAQIFGQVFLQKCSEQSEGVNQFNDKMMDQFIENEKELESEKRILLQTCRKSVEAKSIMEILFEKISKNHVILSFKFLAIFIQEYKNKKIHLKSEDQIYRFITENVKKTAQKLKQVIKNTFISKKQDCPHQEKLQKLTKIWMESFFLSMNGIFEKEGSRRRRVNIEEMLTDEEDSKPYKMTKIC